MSTFTECNGENLQDCPICTDGGYHGEQPKSEVEEILYDQQYKFPSEEERVNFIAYCEYMIWSPQDVSQIRGMKESDLKPYFRPLYRIIESYVVERMMKEIYPEGMPTAVDLETKKEE